MSETFKCFKDICDRNIHYCEPEKERCYKCEDINFLCNSTTQNIPSQCTRFCVDYLLKQYKTDGDHPFEKPFYSCLGTSIGILLVLTILFFVVRYLRARESKKVDIIKDVEIEELLLNQDKLNKADQGVQTCMDWETETYLSLKKKRTMKERVVENNVNTANEKPDESHTSHTNMAGTSERDTLEKPDENYTSHTNMAGTSERDTLEKPDENYTSHTNMAGTSERDTLEKPDENYTSHTNMAGTSERDTLNKPDENYTSHTNMAGTSEHDTLNKPDESRTPPTNMAGTSEHSILNKKKEGRNLRTSKGNLVRQESINEEDIPLPKDKLTDSLVTSEAETDGAAKSEVYENDTKVTNGFACSCANNCFENHGNSPRNKQANAGDAGHQNRLNSDILTKNIYNKMNTVIPSDDKDGTNAKPLFA